MMAERAIARWNGAEETQRQPYRSATQLRSGRLMVSQRAVNPPPHGIPRSSRGRFTSDGVAKQSGTALQTQMNAGAIPAAVSGRNESRNCRAVVESVTTLACHASGAGSNPVGPAAERQDDDLRPSSGRHSRTTVVTTRT